MMGFLVAKNFFDFCNNFRLLSVFCIRKFHAVWDFADSKGNELIMFFKNRSSIMKRQIVLMFAVVVFVLGAGLAIGEDDKKVQPKPDKSKQVKGDKRSRPAKPRRPEDRPGGAQGRRSDRTPRNPRAGFDQQLDQRGRRHKAEMKQLEAIKKMAVEENATKTADMIQKLIDKKQKAFDEVVEQGEKRREQFMKMMEERGDRAPGEREGRRGPRSEREGKGEGKKKAEKDKNEDKDKD